MPYYPPASAGGAGTVTSVTATLPLSGGTITGSGTIAINSSVIGREEVTSAAAGSRPQVSVATRTTSLTSDGLGNSYVSLPNGTYTGQRKTFVFYTQAQPGDVVRVVPEVSVGGASTLEDTVYATYFALVNPHDNLEMEWTGGSKWRVIDKGKTVTGA